MSGRHPWPPPLKGQHASDCAVNNEPAFPAGSCDCGAHSDAATGRRPRLCCVYCGTRIPCAHTLPRLLACVQHASLVAIDPHYA